MYCTVRTVIFVQPIHLLKSMVVKTPIQLRVINSTYSLAHISFVVVGIWSVDVCAYIGEHDDPTHGS